MRPASVGEAVALFLQTLPNGGADAAPELSKLVRWFGRDRSLQALTPQEAEEYSNLVASAELASAEERLKLVRGFFIFAKKRELLPANLATHVKLRRPSKAVASGGQLRPVFERAQLTQEGYTQLRARLEWLQEERARISVEIRKAAADKDVRENAPLEAAREYQGQVMSRIRELEAVLQSAYVLPEGETSEAINKVRQGRRVTLVNAATGQQLTYILVDPREASLVDGKISTDSPVGRALLERWEGEEVEVAAPRGAVRYRILKVE
ncbi:MAG: transcription elongation factor GreA [Chloroflexi bacterium]|nr:transcription elongation factor GreA [Chloroflexota bacterium]